jgi:glucan biosynthesis protein
VQAAARQLAQRLPARGKLIGFGLTGAVALLLIAAQTVTLLMIYAKWNQKVVVESGAGERIEYRLFYYHDSDRATDAGLDWLRRRVQGKEVVAVTDPQWAYLRIGLKAVLPPSELDTEKAQQLLDSVPVKYLLVDESRYKKYTTRVVAAYPDRWQRVYAEATVEEDGRPGKFEIYERINLQ